MSSVPPPPPPPLKGKAAQLGIGIKNERRSSLQLSTSSSFSSQGSFDHSVFVEAVEPGIEFDRESVEKELVELLERELMEEVNQREGNGVVWARFGAVGSRLQVGPSCGIIGIGMIGDCLIGGKNSGMNANEGTWNAANDDVGMLFELAVERGYSMEGELFGGQDVVELINEYYCGEIQATLEHGWDGDQLVKWMGDGDLCMVCYDADKDHTPIMVEGAKAHWGVIMGIVGIRDRKEEEIQQFGENTFICDLDEVNKEVEGDINVEWVLARHGKTKRIGLWKLSSLMESNGGLGQGAWQSKGEQGRWKIPEDMGDLRNSIIVCSNTNKTNKGE